MFLNFLPSPLVLLLYIILQTWKVPLRLFFCWCLFSFQRTGPKLLRPVWITHSNKEKSTPVFHPCLTEKVTNSSTRLSLFLALLCRYGFPGRLMHRDTPKGPRGTPLRTYYFTSSASEEEKYIWRAAPFFPSEAAFKQTDSTAEVTKKKKKSREMFLFKSPFQTETTKISASLKTLINFKHNEALSPYSISAISFAGREDLTIL